MLGSLFEKHVLRNNCSLGYLRVLTQITAHTSVLEVVNAYGVVIPLPKMLRNGHLPNFVRLMDPFTDWDGGRSVCWDYDEDNKLSRVYSNVPKLVQIICWTCMHTNQVEGCTNELPFRFRDPVDDLNTLFGKKRSKGKYWGSIENSTTVEESPKPSFHVIGESEGFHLMELLECILKSDASWAMWDEMLCNIPTNGLGNLSTTSSKNILTLRKNDEKYNKLAISLGFLQDPDNEANLPSDSDPELPSETKREKRKKKTTTRTARKTNQSVKQQTKKVQQHLDSTTAPEADPVPDEVDHERSNWIHEMIDSIPDSIWPNGSVERGDSFELSQQREGKDLVLQGLFKMSLASAGNVKNSAPFTKARMKLNNEDLKPEMEEVLKKVLKYTNKMKAGLVSSLLDDTHGNEPEENNKAGKSDEDDEDDEDDMPLLSLKRSKETDKIKSMTAGKRKEIAEQLGDDGSESGTKGGRQPIREEEKKPKAKRQSVNPDSENEGSQREERKRKEMPSTKDLFWDSDDSEDDNKEKGKKDKGKSSGGKRKAPTPSQTKQTPTKKQTDKAEKPPATKKHRTQKKSMDAASAPPNQT
jgi:hypothetical protein